MNAKRVRPGSVEDGCLLMAAHPSLAGCVFAAFVRDTRHLNLNAGEWINYFPATRYCAITLFLECPSGNFLRLFNAIWRPSGALPFLENAPSIIIGTAPASRLTICH